MRTIDLTLQIWRQKNTDAPGDFETYTLNNISTAMSFLEMLDLLNENLTLQGLEPVAFDHDCREGICGMCGAMVNGIAHGPEPETTLPAAHAPFSQRRHPGHRTVSLPGLSGEERSRDRPFGP